MVIPGYTFIYVCMLAFIQLYTYIKKDLQQVIFSNILHNYYYILNYIIICKHIHVSARAHMYAYLTICY